MNDLMSASDRRLGHALAMLRLRYWFPGHIVAWFKEKFRRV